MVPPQYSPSDTTSARSPLAVVQRAAVKERGHLTAALLSRAGSAVPRDGCRRFIRAKSLAQSYLILSDKLVCFNQKLYGLAANRFPGVLPLRHDKRSLTARGSVMGGCQRARSFDSRAIKSRGKRGSARHFLFRTPKAVRNRTESLLFLFLLVCQYPLAALALLPLL